MDIEKLYNHKSFWMRLLANFILTTVAVSMIVGVVALILAVLNLLLWITGTFGFLTSVLVCIILAIIVLSVGITISDSY